nr:MAG: ORF1 [TTV-like mini virus]
MPPFQRYWYYNRYRNWRRNRRPRYKRWRPRRTIQRRRRRYRVRRKNFYYKKHKKLKKLKIFQFQPNHIRKCKIKGILQLFGAGKGRFSNNFTLYKESFVNPHEPGGGGWSLQQLTLGNLYIQNQFLMNYWTVSNKGLNLCRYINCKLTLYRQQNTDYIFLYDIEPPYNVTKYYYNSLHPMKLLTYHKKILVPSFKTQPHNKKPYVRKKIQPPKELTNKWYFQQHLSNTPLLQFITVACSLNSMFQPTDQLNNNCSIFTINTNFFQNSAFANIETQQWGYQPRQNTYLYGLQQASVPWNSTLISGLTYLGNTQIMDPGDPISGMTKQEYRYPHWGNPFHPSYLDGTFPTIISSKSPEELIEHGSTKPISSISPPPVLRTEPMIIELRYNPNHDKGTGNVAYWIPNNVLTQNTWNPTTNPDLQIESFPLWILLWGWEDFTIHITHITNLWQNYTLVIRSKSLDQSIPNIVPVSYNFTQGLPPYSKDEHDITLSDHGHWYPKWRFQKESIEGLLQTGPAVCKSEQQKSIQAHMKYNFFFKWGGNPSNMEKIFDPTAQPAYPIPNLLQGHNEIISPATNISNFIYDWDTRRDMLTKAAENRIKQCEIHESSLFTDGTTTSTASPNYIYQETQKKTTQKEKEETLLLQLNELKQHNLQLEHRIRQLNQLMQELS